MAMAVTEIQSSRIVVIFHAVLGGVTLAIPLVFCGGGWFFRSAAQCAESARQAGQVAVHRQVGPTIWDNPKSSGLVVVFGGISGSFRRSAALRVSR